MLCVENNQLIEDAATGSASTCLQAFLLKYHAPDIQIINHQGRLHQQTVRIYFDGRTENDFDIKWEVTQFIAKANGKFKKIDRSIRNKK
jgi:trans-2,3-dihydro-3-hydroxyanthranilate isomerase